MGIIFFAIFLTPLTFGNECTQPLSSGLPAIQAILKITSPSKLKKFLTENEASNLFNALIQDPHFKMLSPGAHCYHRSQLIGKNLEDQGIYSEQLYIDCGNGNQALFAVEPNGRVMNYGDHWTNVIDVKNSSTGKLEKMVFDTQFSQKPIPLETYVKNLVQPGFTIKKSNSLAKNAFTCAYRLVDRHSYQELRSNIGNQNNALEEKIGLVDQFGGTAPHPTQKQKEQFEKEKIAPAEWFDTRMTWDENALKRFRKEIEEVNQSIITSAPQETLPDAVLAQKKKAAIAQYLDYIEADNERYNTQNSPMAKNWGKDTLKFRKKQYEWVKESVKKQRKMLEKSK